MTVDAGALIVHYNRPSSDGLTASDDVGTVSSNYIKIRSA